MRRALAALPLLVAATCLALSSTLDAVAKDPRKPHARRSPADTAARPTQVTASRNGVVEGRLPRALAAADAPSVCPAEMANVDGRFCVDRWEASLVEVTADATELPWPPFGAISAVGE